MKCQHCKIELTESEAYEYRGAYSCADHFDQVIASRDYERQEIIQEENARTERFKGLDMSPATATGRANIDILKPTKKESGRLKKYEGRD